MSTWAWVLWALAMAFPLASWPQTPWSDALWRWLHRWRNRLHRAPCCSSCNGTGYSGDYYTNGLCWDCRATGHPHAPDRWNRMA